MTSVTTRPIHTPSSRVCDYNFLPFTLSSPLNKTISSIHFWKCSTFPFRVRQRQKGAEYANEAWSTCEWGETFHLGGRCKVMKLTPVSTPLGWACMDHYRQGERTAQSQRTPRNTHTHIQRRRFTHMEGMKMYSMSTLGILS